MIPLRALIYNSSFPAITLALIIANALVFLYEMILPPYAAAAFEQHYALIPDRLLLSSFLTSMFLHAGWLHIIGNMWFLWVFGSHIETALGSVRYLAFYLLSGLAASVAQFVVSLGSPVPTVGASGAIAGVMGAFLLLYPRARIDTLIFIVIFITRIQIPAAFMLLYWFVLQLFGGLSSFDRVFGNQGGVAYFAHVGGFLAGLAMVALFRATGQIRQMNYYYR
jgi:membrane associated rhomboid family serine protease